jgi:hypothetical protein
VGPLLPCLRLGFDGNLVVRNIAGLRQPRNYEIRDPIIFSDKKIEGHSDDFAMLQDHKMLCLV